MNKKYNILYADPPWSFNNKNTGGSMKSGANAQYFTMSLDEMKDLDIDSIIDEDCILFMWWVGSQPLEALELMDSWGFTLKTMTGFTWVKKTKNWKNWFGMGFWTRQGTENCLLAIRGNPKRISASIRAVLEDFDTSIEAVCEKHSKKPKIFADMIVELCGDIPRLEMFARDKKEGWHIWGNELKNDIEF
jgi:N6-adenosine-specific RNA methylase IME4